VDEIFLAWRAPPPKERSLLLGVAPEHENDDTAIWWTRCDGEGFGRPRQYPPGTTASTPGLAVYGDELCFAWTDAEDGSTIYLGSVPLHGG
jgi:hypothetical protein